MDRCESTARLLECDELDLVTQSTESEDYSSGYDSATESSDVDTGSDTSDPRDDGCDVGVVKRYRSTHILFSDLKYILSMPELCDVKFLVGEKKIPVYGVKAILATRSRVFYSLILNIQRQKELAATSNDKKKHVKETLPCHHLVIEVNKYKPEDFRRIIQFVHCGTVDINVSNVVGLYCGASQFGLSDLKTACWDYIQSALKKMRTRGFLKRLDAEIQDYSQHKSSQRLQRKINAHVASTAEEHRRKETAI